MPEALRNVDIEDTIAKLPKSRSTMITLSDSFYPIIRKAGYSDDFACNVLSVVGLGSRPVMMSMFVKRGSPLREIFNNKYISYKSSQKVLLFIILQSYTKWPSFLHLFGSADPGFKGRIK